MPWALGAPAAATLDCLGPGARVMDVRVDVARVGEAILGSSRNV